MTTQDNIGSKLSSQNKSEWGDTTIVFQDDENLAINLFFSSIHLYILIKK